MSKLVKQLELRNIGRIEHEVIEFGMLTAIVGENSSGKSLCIYAPLEIGLLGDTFPEGLIREGAKDGSFKIVFTDGSSLERTRTRANKQTLSFVYADGTKKDYSTVKDMKAQTQAFTGCTEVELDKNQGKESFQFIPLDAPQIDVLLRQDPGPVLRRVSKVVGGTGEETAKYKLESEVRKFKVEKGVRQEIYDKIHERIETVWAQVDFTNIDDTTMHLSNMVVDHEEATKTLDLAITLLDRWDMYTIRLSNADSMCDLNKVGGRLAELRGYQAFIVDTDKRLATIPKMMQRYDAITSRHKLDAAGETAHRMDEMLPELRALQEITTEAKEKHDRVTLLLLGDYEADQRWLACTRELDAVRKEIKEYVPETPVCKTCGQELLRAAA